MQPVFTGKDDMKLKASLLQPTPHVGSAGWRGAAQGGGEPRQVSPETHNLPILNPCKSLNTLK